MEYPFEQWVNHVVHAHPLVASVVVEFSNWGVALFGVLAVGLWLLSPAGRHPVEAGVRSRPLGGGARAPRQPGDLARLGPGAAL